MADENTVNVDLTSAEVNFLADLVGGTGDFVWGSIARSLNLSPSDVETLFDKLRAVAPKTSWVHSHPTIEGLITQMSELIGQVNRH
jgi:hypothetical protein